jgi:hypothetical protein
MSEIPEEIKADVREYLLKSLDAIEKYIEETPTAWDNIIAMPAINYLRKRLER